MKMEERDRLIREDGIVFGISQGISQGIIQGQTAAIQSFIDTHRKEGTDESQIHAMIQKFFQLSENDASSLLESTSTSASSN